MATQALARIGPRVSLADLFDAAGRLRPLSELPPELTTAIAAFDVGRTTTWCKGETVITEELVRVKLRDGRKARVTRGGPTTLSSRMVSQKPPQRRIVTTRERWVGAGRTEAAEAIPQTGDSRQRR